MTLQPVVPVTVLALLALVLIGLRVVALRRLVRTRGGRGIAIALWRWSAVTLAVLLLLAAAARPGIRSGEALSGSSSAPGDGGTGLNLFFVVDRSVDSRAEDSPPGAPRIAAIRDDITALIDHYGGAQFAVISFASSASMDWPLSDDVWSLKPLIAGMSTYGSASADAIYEVDAGAAHELLRTHLAQAMQWSPGSTNLVFYFGEGAGGSQAPQSRFAVEPEMLSGGAVFGYGTDTGGPIPQRVVDGDVTYAGDARTGGRLISRIDEPALRQTAAQLGVPYVRRDSAQTITSTVPVVDARISGSRGDVGAARVIELYWGLALGAAALMLIEIGATIWRFRRSRSVRVEL